MNCELFNEVVHDLVRVDPDGSIIAGFVEAHAKGCDRCAEVLTAQQLLQIKLKMLAASQQGAEAPESLELLLREAFVSNHAGRAKAQAWSVRAGTIARLVSGSGLSRPVRYSALATAAALLLVAGILLFSRSQHTVDKTAVGRPGVESEQPQAPRDLKSTPPRLADSPPPVAPYVSATGTQGSVSGGDHGTLAITSPGSGVARRTRRHSSIDQVEDSSEVATDFMPVDFGGNMMPSDGGRVLRIKVPRSVMFNYGLPINPDRIDEPINADLVVGNDGLATAIRFVEENAVEKSRHAR
jgi:hypothetical protein